MPRSNFTYNLAGAILRQKGHFLLVASRQDTDVIGHTRVVYGVGVPDEAWFSAFNGVATGLHHGKLLRST